MMLPACVSAVALWRWRVSAAASSVIAFGFLIGGAALAVDARERALHPSIREVLEREFGGFAIESIGPAGRHDPIPTRAILVDDASARDDFVSIRVRILALKLHD